MASLSERGLSTELSGKSSTLVLTEISFALIPSVVTLEKNIPICIKQCYLHFTVDGRNVDGRAATSTSALKLFKDIFPITAVSFPNESTNKYPSTVTRVQQREMMHGGEESSKIEADPFTIDYKREGQERTKGETKDGEEAWSQS